MWIVVDYEPVAAFGLRPSNTTSSGGKSLLVPTPYAIKMALLDRLIRYGGLDYGVDRFPLVRDLEIELHVPFAVAVNRTFQKVLRPGGKGEIWNQTIAQREYVFHAGSLSLAFGLADAAFTDEIVYMLPSINYFGRKGSFMQFVGHRLLDDPPGTAQGYIDLCHPTETLGFGFLQRMDNMRSDATFEDVSVYGSPRSDGGRISYNVILPYQLAHHGFNHTVYEVEPQP
ncbi:MAG TPA: hypothetical protein PKD09_15195 [Aggregatilinea sp.]|uniref:hypothetical protein n=1 Tax=Aggregatilinea sp. TaxID=2806333 RepID=UPI002CB6D785|nr:hypothetical protein [Aggregatilinea sp.]HML22997.1 hypothetical protein [Aggregatilinea sp.]